MNNYSIQKRKTWENYLSNKEVISNMKIKIKCPRCGNEQLYTPKRGGTREKALKRGIPIWPNCTLCRNNIKVDPEKLVSRDLKFLKAVQNGVDVDRMWWEILR